MRGWVSARTISWLTSVLVKALALGAVPEPLVKAQHGDLRVNDEALGTAFARLALGGQYELFAKAVLSI